MSAAGALACPICQESMVTLAQLNRHLDDAHSEVAQPEQEQLRSWFRKKMDRARQLQSVATVLDSLGVKDGSEYSGADTGPASSGTSTPTAHGVAGGAGGAGGGRGTPDDMITRKHWQKRVGGESCTACGKALNARNGCVHCRHCGLLFCSADTAFRMKLDADARPDPGSGVWARVCEGCYTARPGWTDVSGTSRDLTRDFGRARRVHVDRQQLESNRLEKRLVRLVSRLDELPPTSGILGVVALRRRRQIEHEAAPWEDDADVAECRLCTQKFGYTLRKHHCRVCGLVVCGDAGTECSHDVSLAQLADKLAHQYPARLSRRDDVSVRVCKTCRDAVFGRINFAAAADSRPQLFELYDALALVRRSIETTLPRFHTLMEAVGTASPNPSSPASLSHDTIEDAAAVRRKLLDAFARYDTLARKILALQTANKTEERLARQIFQVAAAFLQEHMLPLRALPKVLGRQPVVTIEDKKNEARNTGLRNQLIVLEEQKFLVENMVNDARSHRKYDEVVPLEQSLQDLDREIQSIRDQLGDYSL